MIQLNIEAETLEGLRGVDPELLKFVMSPVSAQLVSPEVWIDVRTLDAGGDPEREPKVEREKNLAAADNAYLPRAGYADSMVVAFDASSRPKRR